MDASGNIPLPPIPLKKTGESIIGAPYWVLAKLASALRPLNFLFSARSSLRFGCDEYDYSDEKDEQQAPNQLFSEACLDDHECLPRFRRDETISRQLLPHYRVPNDWRPFSRRNTQG
jgi:hypothetical protein